MTWDWAFTWEVLPPLLKAARITLLATVLGFGVSVVFGLVLALLRRSRWRGLAWATGAFVEVVRSTPLLVQLYFLYFVLPDYGVSVSALTVGIFGLGVHYSAYTSEVYRSGLQGVARGQWEAALALNLSRYRTYRDVILPQALRPVIPALGNYFVAMFKDTPLLSAITVVEVLQEAKIIGSDTFQYLEPITVVGVLFLLLSAGASASVRLVEKSVPRQGIPLK
jgi:polar amino acid transport system permease protein